MIAERIKSTVREVPDFPKPGISFKDITPILEDHQLVNDITDAFAQNLTGHSVDGIAGIESRGFLFGMLLAQKMKVPFITIRKKGKLPYKTVSYRYDLEYGSAEIEMHQDTINPGMKILVHDDLLATGGTAAAAAHLITAEGGEIAGFSFLIELSFLNGVEKLTPFTKNIINLLTY